MAVQDRLAVLSERQMAACVLWPCVVGSKGKVGREAEASTRGLLVGLFGE